MRKIKEVIIINLISLIFMSLVLILIYFTNINNPELDIIILIIFGIWSYSIPISYLYWYKNIYIHYKNRSFEEGVIVGRFLVITPILIAPIYMFKYYLLLFKKDENNDDAI